MNIINTTHLPHSLIDPHIVNQHTRRQVLTHPMGYCTGTFILTAVKTITITALRTRSGKTPGTADGRVEQEIPGNEKKGFNIRKRRMNVKCIL